MGRVELVATTLYVSNLPDAVSWYQDMLGLQPAAVGSDGHDYASFVMGSAIVVLEPIEAALEPTEMGRENTTVNLVVSRDPTEVRDDLIGRGVACGPLVKSNFLSFLVRDPDGNRFYITRPVSPQAEEAVRQQGS